MQPEQLLGLVLVHRERALAHARAGVRDAEQLEQALDAAVLAVGPVQRDEGDVDLFLAQHAVDVAVDEDLRGVVAAAHERGVDRLAARDRDLVLRAQPPHQDTHALVLHARSFGALTRGPPVLRP